MKFLIFVILCFFAPPINAVYACPDADNTATPLVYAIFLPTAGYEKGVKMAESYFRESLALQEEHAGEAYALFSKFNRQHGNHNWPRKIKTQFLKETADLGIGYALFAYGSRISRDNEPLAATYIKKAVDQNYLPAFEEYASYLIDLEYRNIHTVAYPENKQTIYDISKVAIKHGCALPKYHLAIYIHFFMPEKKEEIIPLLLDFIDDKDAIPSNRENAIKDLCVLGVGNAFRKPLEQRWCAKSYSSFRTDDFAMK